MYSGSIRAFKLKKLAKYQPISGYSQWDFMCPKCVHILMSALK